ncbi:Cytoplasmic tRNA 2-thiolation protein 1 [Sciurus carolinensis]|uniref:Cytoplasmic tRNA 2-thiolation protein 1 n=1 Tax=Sciurus carolinensis TaxID=30640 RepID=A0AA41TC11_SCICA|nr:Cytoplasmic tRNA 2-thiolation protein 1 [Sciurus carolinensis]
MRLLALQEGVQMEEKALQVLDLPVVGPQRGRHGGDGAHELPPGRREAVGPGRRAGLPGRGGALQLASQNFSEECVYAPEAFRGHARDLLKLLEAARPSAVLDLVHSAERLALARTARPPRPGACSRCGALASRALLDGLNRGRPRLAIGKGRRGLDEEAPRGRGSVPVAEAVAAF